MPIKYKLVLSASVFALMALLSDLPMASANRVKETRSTTNGDYEVYVKGIS